ncbi:hypothetical protein CRG98_026688 [Punica granatum]|uniref:MCM10 OB-fold domain-containing protein n=1 Tax=Punica granatum TaxID=22663 RepID=A0A2I0J9E2_PUNGR|nr:hypothetical protein CRG98_026688 [Punica granatum]
MSAFKNAVEDCLDYDPKSVKKESKSNRTNVNADPEVEKFSGLRIRNQLLTPAELNDHFSDIRFVRLSVIMNVLKGDNLSGSWATVGVLVEKGHPKTSSNGKSYSIWKLGSLNEDSISLFLFGDAYQQNMNEKAGTVFALFNCNVRRDNSKASEKYSSVSRTLIQGGNIRTAYRDHLKSEGIYLVNPLVDRSNTNKGKQPAKVLSVEGLKKALRWEDIGMGSFGSLYWYRIKFSYLELLTEVSPTVDEFDGLYLLVHLIVYGSVRWSILFNGSSRSHMNYPAISRCNNIPIHISSCCNSNV